MLTPSKSRQISSLFKMISDPFRIRLLLAVSGQEACVCHLESMLGRRQAYISQHLMSLREAGILTTRKSGKYVFYKLKDRNLLSLIRQAAAMQEVDLDLPLSSSKATRSNCACPNCAPSNLIAID